MDQMTITGATAGGAQGLTIETTPAKTDQWRNTGGAAGRGLPGYLLLAGPIFVGLANCWWTRGSHTAAGSPCNS